VARRSVRRLVTVCRDRAGALRQQRVTQSPRQCRCKCTKGRAPAARTRAAAARSPCRCGAAGAARRGVKLSLHSCMSPPFNSGCPPTPQAHNACPPPWRAAQPSPRR
jgi:hypothetical protein